VSCDSICITDWITAIDSIVTTVIGLPAGIVGVLAFIKSGKTKKDNTLANIKIKINTAKRQCETLAMEMVSLHEKETEYQIKKKFFEGAFKGVIKAYNKACEKFFNKEVNQEEFNLRYQKDILGYVEDFPYILDGYKYIKKYYEEYKDA